MNRKMFHKVALSSLMIATTMVGCTGAAFRPSASAAQVKGDPARLAATAEKAIAGRDGAKAVEAAEAAVQLSPQNAAYRHLLGRAYIAAGRFASAQSALSDAMALGNSDASTIVSLALVQVAQGRADEARALLADHADTVPAGDYGLAMAMAGDAGEGVRVLSEAIHDPSATARTRQNLAYAYALAGRWKDARLMAGLDMEPLAANKRISDWAQMAEPSLAPLRVAALMGVTPAADPGQPVALALAAPVAAPMALAQADPAPEAAAPVEAPQPEAVAVADAVDEAAPAPISFAERAAIRARLNDTAPPRLSARVAKAPAFRPATGAASNWVVQLGAYDSAAVAKEKWFAMARRNGTIAAFPVVTSQATVNGKAYHRLAVSGFGGRADALGLCRAIRAQSGQCFVRQTSPDATLQRWALATRGRQFAGR
ncbi:pilus assembly protein TadD [Sphingobium amiense]|uniref:Pilus assembly protein TadD n=1 Tax=Sphingobium amiense TaxID=135719 RepID=A0A494VYR6_9SPHN|nr:SPOR domain-containing protein [Sphingobium amiense]BBD97553.1 pilus assembly protein TadD [Sphingobium amiense]